MSIHIQGDRAWFEPMNPKRHNPDGSYTIGCHQGPTYHLNIRNPKPGFVYYYEANRPNAVQRKLTQGWEFVRPSDPEQWGAEIPEDVQQELGGIRLNKDVVLMRIPEERYAVLTAERDQQAALARGGSAEEYLARGRDAQERLSNRGISTDDDLYYRSSHHSESSE